MASKSLGTLTLDLVAKIGGYTAGLDKAEKEAQKRAKAIEKAFDGAANAAGVAFGAMAVAATAAFAAINQGIDYAASFQDLAEETGASAEGLASLAVAAGTAGVDMNSMAAASIKLTKNLTGVDDESKAAGAALAALNIPIEEFKKLSPEQQIDKLSQSFAQFEDGAGKTAVALDLWGKSGAEQLKVMKALEEQGGRTVILTAEQIKQADEFADAQAKAQAELKLYASAVATQFLPAITAFTGVLADAAKEMVGVGKEATSLGQNNGVATFAEAAVDKLAFVVDAAQGVATVFSRLGEFIGATAAASVEFVKGNTEGVKAIKDAYNESLNTSQFKSIRSEYQKALADQKKLKALAAQENRGFNPGAQTLNYSGKTSGGGKKGGGGGDDPTKKLLDNDLKALKAQSDAAKDLLADRNKTLDLANQQGLLSVQDYYNGLKTAQEESFSAQRASLDAQIAALQAYQAKAGKATDRADAQGKINDLLVQQAKLERESGMAALEMGVKQQQAMKSYRDSLDEVNAKILEMDGNLGAAAEIRFDKQNEQLRKLAEASGDFASVRQIDRLKAYTVAQANINSLQQKFSLAQGDLAIAEERISQARERGTMGEIESLNASGVARQQAIAVMQKQLDMYQALDKASLTDEQIQQIERLKVQLEGLKATADPLADRFNTLFSDAAGDALGDYLTGVKTAKEATKDFLKSVTDQITKMVAQDLGKKLFGSVMGGDSGGGVGGFLSSIFGGGSKTGSAGFDWSKIIGAVGFASGGYTGHGAANDPAGIVHKGEYVLDAETTRRLGVQNLDRGNFGGQTVNFAIQGKMDLRTQEQIAQRTRQAQLQTASRFRG